jgi:hypothetical protein
MRAYDGRICKEKLDQIERKAATLELQLLPKKKFGFKKKGGLIGRKEEDRLSPDKTDSSHSNQGPLLPQVSSLSTFRDLTGETLSLDQLSGGDVLLSNLHNCTVIIRG